ncbi:MAG TPA: 2TM domain-containing protein [Actinomycetes bacterium]|nr:2TM domain-containing protein [Actinomycetes bacterium]
MRESTVEDTRGDFTAHAALYVLVMAALIVLNFALLTGFWWSGMVLVGWGIVLGLHYLYLRRIAKADTARLARTEQGAATAKPAA